MTINPQTQGDDDISTAVFFFQRSFDRFSWIKITIKTNYLLNLEHLRVAHFCGFGNDKKRPFVCRVLRYDDVLLWPRHATTQKAAITKATFICKWKLYVFWFGNN